MGVRNSSLPCVHLSNSLRNVGLALEATGEGNHHATQGTPPTSNCCMVWSGTHWS
jgi:hypothetical protein